MAVLRLRWRPMILVSTVAIMTMALGAWPSPTLAGSSQGVHVAPFAGNAARQTSAARLLRAYGALPLAFVRNQGQAAPGARFIAYGSGYTIAVTAAGVVLTLRRSQPGPADIPLYPHASRGADAVVRLTFRGANAHPRIDGLDRLSGASNYFYGPNPSAWHLNVPAYARVAYRGLYPGVDLVLYGRQGRLEYDLVVAPHANPRVVQMSVDGALIERLDARGNVLLRVAGGELSQAVPRIYQDVRGSRRSIAGRFVLLGAQRVGFALGAYDRRYPLIIDPTLWYSTYLGGKNIDMATGIAVDAGGNAYVTGLTTSTDFPTTTGAFSRTLTGYANAFVTKLNATGSALVYSTYLGGTSAYLGGSGFSAGSAIAVDGSGNAYVTGMATAGFPTTPGAYSTTSKGLLNAFVTKLGPNGNALLYSTYLGGSKTDYGRGIAVGPAGNAYVTGYTSSTDFPTKNALQSTSSGGYDAFITKLAADGTSLLYSTYLGGSGDDYGRGIAIDDAGNAYVAGQTSSPNFPLAHAFQASLGGSQDAFVAKLNSSGNGLIFSTYLGGSGVDDGNAIAVGQAGNAFVTGQTSSIDFPLAHAWQSALRGRANAFVAKLATDGRSLAFSTYLGGSGADSGNGITIDRNGAVYVTGSTSSPDFPLTNAIQASYGGSGDAFLSKVAADGSSLIQSTYLGGSSLDSGSAVAVDSELNAYVAGFTISTNFPTTTGAFSMTNAGFLDGFVAKIGPS